MEISESDRRLIENEVVFRSWNESVHGLNSNNENYDPGKRAMTGTFICECSDESCGESMSINFQDYGEIHKQRDCFVVVRGHETEDIEDVELEQPEYNVVRKYVVPPENANGLNDTKNS